MFHKALSFNGDISKWDVSNVENMNQMFQDAKSFKKKLCGAAWVHSKARKNLMFEGSYGSISETVCNKTTSTFSPRVRKELKRAIVACLQLSPKGDCPNGPYESMGKWDVSSVADMSDMFNGVHLFNGDISKWDVSSATTMLRMFWSAKSFNGDISKWDVSSVANMYGMFSETSFNGDISKWDVSSVGNMNAMFHKAASFDGDISKWDVSSVADMNEMFQDVKSFKQKL